MGEAEPDRSLSLRPQGLVHQRRTVAAGTGGYAICNEELVAYLGRIVVADVQCHDGAALPGAEVAVNGHAGDVLDPLVKSAHQCLFPAADRVDAFFQQIANGCPQPGDAMAVQCTGFQCGGHLGGMALIVGLDAAAAGQQGPYKKAGFHIQPSRPLGSQQPFVSGKAQDRDAHLLHIDGKDPRGLGGVHDKEKPMRRRDLSHPPDIHQISGEIRGMGADDGLCIFTDIAPERLIVDPPQPVAVQDGQFYAFFLHLVEGPQDRIVLQRGGDHVISRRERPLYGDVQALRGVGCEGDLFWVFGVEQPSQFFPDLVDDPGGPQRRIVKTSAGVSHGAHG